MFWVTQNVSGYSRKPCRRVASPKSGNLFKPAVFLVYSLYFMPYNLILLYSVVRPMPSSSAANARLPFACPTHGGFVSSPYRPLSVKRSLPPVFCQAPTHLPRPCRLWYAVPPCARPVSVPLCRRPMCRQAVFSTFLALFPIFPYLRNHHS